MQAGRRGSGWLREPLIHFLVLGGLVFAMYGWLNRGAPSVDDIVVTRVQQERLIDMFVRTWQREPTPEEFQALVNDFIREEVAYREGLAMSLHEGDVIIRRRMRQKMELLADDQASGSPLTEDELTQFLADNAETFRIEPRLGLRQIFINQDKHGDRAEEIALQLREAVQGDPDADWRALGDSLPLPTDYADVGLAEIARLFGQGFAEQLDALEPGNWSAPIRSAYGLHVIIVDNKTPARDPELTEVRDRVRFELLDRRRREAVATLYDRLVERYRILIEPLSEDAEE
jgi:hypothetical protein